MAEVVFRYRSRELDIQDIQFIRKLISKHYDRGRSHISRVLCEAWQWIQPNGKLKEYAARDLLLRLEENGFIELPPRLRPKNNLKQNSFNQVPLFFKNHKPFFGTGVLQGNLHHLYQKVAENNFAGQGLRCFHDS